MRPTGKIRPARFDCDTDLPAAALRVLFFGVAIVELGGVACYPAVQTQHSEPFTMCFHFTTPSTPTRMRFSENWRPQSDQPSHTSSIRRSRATSRALLSYMALQTRVCVYRRSDGRMWRGVVRYGEYDAASEKMLR